MARSQSSKLALLAVAGSISLHGGLLLFVALRPAPPPRLAIAVTGPGEGAISAAPGDLHCGEACTARYQRGTHVELRAHPGEESTFEGWPSDCEVGDSPLSCTLELRDDVRVQVRFGRPPPEVDVAWVRDDELPQPSRSPIEVALPELEPDVEIEPEAAVPPPPPEPPTEDEPPEPVEMPERSKLRSVEVPDQNEVERAPDDARFLSDKNRDVQDETRAVDTNLERSAEGEVPASEPSELDLDEVGGPEDVIAHLETTEPASNEPEPQPPEPPPAREPAQGASAPAEGEGGEPEREPSMLSMRDIGGAEMPGGPLSAEPERGPDGAGPGAPGRRGINTRLSHEDYERIVGADRVREEVEIGRRRMSQRKGRWERRQEALRASLENFTPEVRPGNQTALKTRAAPFAVYIARMHRRIHERWGFGVLVDLSRKSSTHELNNWRLRTKLEIVLGPDGRVERTTIVEPSGVLAFDVAAIDVVQTAGPYETPPEAIRSGNGRVYVHWNFHRDWRQCGTFGAHPFILDNAGEADKGIDDGAMLDALPGRGAR